jgi:hypothetical protein
VRFGQRRPPCSVAALLTTRARRYASTTTRGRSNDSLAPARATKKSVGHSMLTARGCAKVAAMLALLHTFIAGEDAATEGKKVITGMLIVGVVIIAVIALGETTHWLRHRRR